MADIEIYRSKIKNFANNMPAISPVAMKLIKLINNIDTSPNDIVSTIMMDPVLTATVLKLVNSAYFNLSQKISSLNRALVYLGLNTIKNLVLSTAVMSNFKTTDKKVASLVEPIWKHSLATAVCSKLMAKEAGMPRKDLEEFFIAGLLHDLGKIMIVQSLAGEVDIQGFTPEVEITHLGCTHSQVGQMLLKKWQFSDILINSAKYHHKPEMINDKYVDFVYLADRMTYRLGVSEGTKVEDFTDSDQKIMDNLGVSEKFIDDSVDLVDEEIEKALIFLENS